MHVVVVLAVVAVAVIGDIGIHIRLIMAQINRSRSVVVMGVVVPVIGRTPRVVTRSSPVRKDRRCAHKDGANIVVDAIDIGRTDDLHIRRSVTHLCGQRGYILEDVRCQHSLDNDDVVVTVDSLHNTQIINISVAVEVQRREHVGGRVEQHLELLQRVSRSKGCAHSAQVEEEADIFAQWGHVDYRCSGLGRRGLDDRGGASRLHVRVAIDHAGRRLGIYDGSARRWSLCRSDNACDATAEEQCCTAKNKTNFFHI